MEIRSFFNNIKLPGQNRPTEKAPGEQTPADNFAFSMSNSGEVKVGGQELHGLKKAGAVLTVVGAAAAGAWGGVAATTAALAASPVVGPLAFWGVGAYVFRGKGAASVNGRDLKDVLTVWKPGADDSKALKFAKNAVNYTTRAAVAATAGILSVAAAPIMGGIAGAKIGMHLGAEAAAHLFGSDKADLAEHPVKPMPPDSAMSKSGILEGQGLLVPAPPESRSRSTEWVNRQMEAGVFAATGVKPKSWDDPAAMEASLGKFPSLTAKALENHKTV